MDANASVGGVVLLPAARTKRHRIDSRSREKSSNVQSILMRNGRKGMDLDVDDVDK